MCCRVWFVRHLGLDQGFMGTKQTLYQLSCMSPPNQGERGMVRVDLYLMTLQGLTLQVESTFSSLWFLTLQAAPFLIQNKQRWAWLFITLCVAWMESDKETFMALITTRGSSLLLLRFMCESCVLCLMSRRRLVTHQRLCGPINLQSLASTLAGLNGPPVQVIVRLFGFPGLRPPASASL